MIRIEFIGGQTSTAAAKECVIAANAAGEECRGLFNDIDMVAQPGEHPGDVEARWWRACAACEETP